MHKGKARLRELKNEWFLCNQDHVFRNKRLLFEFTLHPPHFFRFQQSDWTVRLLFH